MLSSTSRTDEQFRKKATVKQSVEVKPGFFAFLNNVNIKEILMISVNMCYRSNKMIQLGDQTRCAVQISVLLLTNFMRNIIRTIK